MNGAAKLHNPAFLRRRIDRAFGEIAGISARMCTDFGFRRVAAHLIRI